MSYAVKEIYFTLQGEGRNTGRAAVFLRFSGCNLWSGRESDRAQGTGSCARWCDTNFLGVDGPGGGRFDSTDALANAALQCWHADGRDLSGAFVVCTGGEPALQLDGPLVDALHARGFQVAIETNGTKELPAGLDWICVSPKAGTELVVQGGHELKLIYPQKDTDPARFEGLAFQHFLLQPLDGLDRAGNTAAAVAYCQQHPRWQMSLQTHKLLGIP